MNVRSSFTSVGATGIDSDVLLCLCVGQFQSVHGAGVRARWRNVFTPSQRWKIQAATPEF